jgi:hypothetical protein
MKETLREARKRASVRGGIRMAILEHQVTCYAKFSVPELKFCVTFRQAKESEIHKVDVQTQTLWYQLGFHIK